VLDCCTRFLPQVPVRALDRLWWKSLGANLIEFVVE
jgi:hypothetical protein